jgi:hypothetical protein
VQPQSEPLDQVLRWEQAGGTWRVLTLSADAGVTVALDSCYGEEMSRLTSADPGLLAWLGDRTSSAD